MDKLKAMKAGKRQYKVNWSLPDVTPQDSGKILYVQEGGQLAYVYPQDISGDDIDVGVTSIAGQEGDFTLGNGLSIDENNEITAITTAIAGHTGNITLGYGLQISEQGELSTKPRVESLGGQTGIITLGSGLSIDDHKILNTTGTKVSTIDNHYGPITLGSGLSINDNNVLDTTGTKVSSIGGKTGDITFETITGDNRSEFAIDSNNVFKRNVHIYQHNISIIISSDNTYINLQFFATFENHITSLTDLTAIINAWLGESSQGEGIIVNGAIRIGALDHQYVIALRGQGANATSLNFVTIQSNGSTSTQTLDQTKTATVVDLVLLLI